MIIITTNIIIIRTTTITTTTIKTTGCNGCDAAQKCDLKFMSKEAAEYGSGFCSCCC